MSKLHIYTQDQENYGAHDWDGEGECPQYWKFKGGEDFYVLNFEGKTDASIDKAVIKLLPTIQVDNEYFKRKVIGWSVVPDDFMTDFEESQLEYKGSITYPVKVLELSKI